MLTTKEHNAQGLGNIIKYGTTFRNNIEENAFFESVDQNCRLQMTVQNALKALK